ncbi:hypothetical protein ACFV0T_05175 [Streptomyces sp. NPDC059582]|uniref:hypothetical protein n=1 Tax=Streptomyces sp. NPDC059582 TaxID=3346875 RepID=UPI00369FD139
MAAPAPTRPLLPAPSKREVGRAFSAEPTYTEAPLTSEPPLPDAEPLTSEPPLAAADSDVTRP